MQYGEGGKGWSVTCKLTWLTTRRCNRHRKKRCESSLGMRFSTFLHTHTHTHAHTHTYTLFISLTCHPKRFLPLISFLCPPDTYMDTKTHNNITIFIYFIYYSYPITPFFKFKAHCTSSISSAFCFRGKKLFKS